MEDQEFCDECGYEVPADDIVEGICSLCYDELYGEFEQMEKFHKHHHDEDE